SSRISTLSLHDALPIFSPVFTYGIGLLGPILGVLVVGLVMWGAYSLLGGASTNFGTAFSITSHAFLTGLVSSPLFILILYLKPRSEEHTSELQSLAYLV